MHIYANPKRFLGIAKWLTPLLFWSGLVLSLGATAWGLFMVPPDRLMGESVRILFIHVPAAWLGMGGWAGIALSSAMLLIWKHPLAGISARAIAVPGMVFTAICLATGSIWGRPTWGTWWVWDGRLTSMLVLLFLYAGYIALVQATAREGGSARIAAIFGLVGAVNIPIINRSVVWWNSLHQPPSITMGQSAIDPVFLTPLLVAVAGFSLLFGAIVLMRMRAMIAEAQVEARLKRRALDDEAPRSAGAGEPAMGGA
ncbi:MAG: heme ABC transporter permease CcmC [Erythrobacter sp.]|uniref:heme ABC transporter permease CcmC n=1 Tax=Erythrobacter sp. HL-111 TaxID=1798193 RepID=UPI0006DB53AC|nr:heme ABC transporter permease CcmC [Erythrobacter sp. HL-111]KPP96206.1 MAG: ABC-type heme export system permease component CcmC [Erythrobacteraceae bacterium HL-111]SDR78083.1 heme exporter protein C [Erythrobacter sp. HL-111]